MHRRLSRSSTGHRTWSAAWHPDLRRSAFCSGVIIYVPLRLFYLIFDRLLG
jgi:hypothetical protein